VVDPFSDSDDSNSDSNPFSDSEENCRFLSLPLSRDHDDSDSVMWCCDSYD